MPQPERVLAVIGGGTMGADIAASFAACGWTAHIVNPPDRVRESLPQRLAQAMTKLGAAYDANNIPPHEKLDAVPWADIGIVIEAVPEQLEVKRPIFAEPTGPMGRSRATSRATRLRCSAR